MKSVGSFWNFHLTSFMMTDNDGTNLTMPDQARSVEELVADIRKGIVPPEFSGSFSDSDEDDMWDDIDVDSMDLAELDELYANARDRLAYLDSYVRPQVNKRYSAPSLQSNNISNGNVSNGQVQADTTAENGSNGTTAENGSNGTLIE